LTCFCGHEFDEHGGIEGHPGSTACTVRGCPCLAYERDPKDDEFDEEDDFMSIEKGEK
jgi:hypothetical protein